MTKKETQKINSTETSKTLFEINGRSNRSQRTTKCNQIYESTKVFETSKYWDRITWLRKLKQKFTIKKNFPISILKSLKLTATNWNLHIGWVICPGKTIETYCYQVHGVQKMTKIGKTKKVHLIFAR